MISNMFAQHFRIEFNREILLKNVMEIQENFGWEIRLQLERARS
ncbi:hypothetical protein THF5G08_50437 [Vibrio jasicida]|nr:hypothetical protein THF5G08_50437 [Vibrio jasicida]